MAFVHVKELPNCAFSDTFLKSELQKWDLSKGSQYHVFRYTRHYHRMQGQQLALDLLNDPAVQQVVKVLAKGSKWQDLQGEVKSVDVEAVPCTLTRMDLFDKLSSSDPPIVRGNGDICKRMEDVVEGFQVSDTLRELLLCDDSENAELYTSEERSQFLWRIFEHLAIGGPCCQFEDRLEPYLEATKRLYRELIAVQKNSAGDRVEIASTVFRIKSIQCTGETGDMQLFPSHSRNNFMYLTIDPLRRLAKLWYHAYIPFW